jgi:tetratricopeptide (TPR) repeat protein
MKRMALAALLLGLFIYVNHGVAQVSKEATVTYRSGGKEATVSGTITADSLDGITVGKKKIAPEDIIDVEYPAPSNESSIARRKALNAEHKRNFEAAIAEYKKIKVTDKAFARHLQYKIAYCTARLAETDAAQQQPAIDLLNAYLQAHPQSWQVVNFPKLLVPLQLKAGDKEGAKATLAALEKQKIPASLLQELNLMSVKILIDTKDYPKAEEKLGDLIKNTKDESQILKFRMQRAECLAATKKLPEARAQLQEILSKTKSNEVKASALNTLGECMRKNGELREAMWDFMLVDVLYSQNKDEHFRAIKNLAEVFDELKDKKKAEQYKAMLKGK